MAHAWSRSMKLGNPYAKSVLKSLCLYVNDTGSCFAGIGTLADDTDLSQDTVRKRLKWLEEIGAIARFPRWIDENGRANSEGKGKRTSDEIRLMIDTDPEVIEARALGLATEESSDETGADAGDISPRHQQGLNAESKTARDSVGPAPALGQPSHCGKGLTPLTVTGTIPPDPPSGGSPEGWLEFEKAWVHPIARPSICHGLWKALSEDERATVTKAAGGYNRWRERQAKPPHPMNAQTFIREIDAWP